jgi:hypothetical protein
MTLRLILTLSLALVPVAASAAPAAQKTASASASERAPAPSRVYDFDPDDVDGETLARRGPTSSTGVRRPSQSIITVRPHFIPQLLKIAIDI